MERTETGGNMKSGCEGVRKATHLTDKVTSKLATEKKTTTNNNNQSCVSNSNGNLHRKDVTNVLLLKGHLHSNKLSSSSRMQTQKCEESSKKEYNSFKMLRYRSKLRSRGSSVGRAMTKAKETKNKPQREKIPQQHTVIPSFFSKPTETAVLDSEKGPAGLGSFPFKVPADGASNYPLSKKFADCCKTI